MLSLSLSKPLSAEDSNRIAYLYEFTVKQFSIAHERINVKKTPDLMCSDLANSRFVFTVPLDNLQHLHMQHHCPVLHGNRDK